MNQEPLVSVIIPTYFRNEKLNKAIDSVENQTYSKIEIIVVDDSGERHAEPAIGSENISYIAFEENRGAQAARTEGIKRASGKYIQLLDDDDQIFENKIEEQVGELERNEDIGVIYSGFIWDNEITVLPDKSMRGDVLHYALTFKLAPCITSTMLIRSSLLSEIIPLNDRPGADDIGFKIELAKRAKFDFVDKPLVLRNNSDDSRGQSRGSYLGREQILSDYLELYQSRSKEELDEARAYTFLQKAEVELSDSFWSFNAVIAAARMCKSYPRPVFFAYLISILFGTPGYKLGRYIYSKYLRGTERRGKI